MLPITVIYGSHWSAIAVREKRKPLIYKGFLRWAGLARFMRSQAVSSQRPSAMPMPDQNLVHKLVIAVVIKLLVLLALWWGFIREQRVDVDSMSAADHVLGASQVKDKE